MQVLAFMRRKRAEVTEQLRLEAEAAKAPVERRLAARRTAASLEVEQVGCLALSILLAHANCLTCIQVMHGQRGVQGLGHRL